MRPDQQFTQHVNQWIRYKIDLMYQGFEGKGLTLLPNTMNPELQNSMDDLDPTRSMA